MVEEEERVVNTVPEFVIKTRWAMEGILLPAVGMLGIGGSRPSGYSKKF